MLGWALLVALPIAWWAWERSRRPTHPVEAGLREEITLRHEAEFELYHNALSLCSMKARVCLAELGIDYRSHPIDLIETGAYENIRPQFLAVNPAGTVPVLVHDGHPIYESHEQIRYAARHAPPGSPSLVPDDPALQAEMDAWIDRSSITEDPLNEGDRSIANAVPGLTLPLFATMIERIPVWRILEGLLFHFDKRRPLMFLVLKAAGVERMPSLTPFIKMHGRSRRQAHAHLDALEARLAEHGGDWILGDAFTLADVSWLVVFERMDQVGALGVYLDPAKRPRSAAYWERLRARPSYAEAILGHPHPLIEYGRQRIVEAKAASPELRAALDGA